ncbi:hypothetical protein [Paenibacillus montanisoli]|uniref:Uncharacterized protein n=1 Tax=Paenibacillus montanisoli TaxID=2081970 RepID=A0A328TSS3_9BACL|nr:hypothetical protein [Paenibacillus montanisoli]RAP73627.1 hypothetical protein DL346_25485 [Paenibacillus montanisoli]
MTTEKKNDRGDLARILGELGQDGLIETLAERLSGSDFNTLLLEVFRRRAARRSPVELLRSYKENRFVKPAVVDPLALKQLEIDLLRIAKRHAFEPVQLSPVAPLGSCSAIAPADQNKIISALRGTEVVADVTNLIALHIADGIKSGKLRNEPDLLRYCTTHRHVRAQKFPDAPGFLPHFGLYAMVTAGRDGGSYSFEIQALWEHISVYRDMFQTQFGAGIEIILNARPGYPDGEELLARTVRFLAEQAPELAVTVNPEPNGNAYYKGLQFTIKTTIGGQVHYIGDGGYVDWTQQLLGGKKERMLISAIGLDRLLLP